MMTALRTMVYGLVLLGVQVVWADDSARSIMFEQNKDYSDITTRPAQPSDQTKDKCTELAEQMNALKGKPQRRFAVSQQYEAECKR